MTKIKNKKPTNVYKTIPCSTPSTQPILREVIQSSGEPRHLSTIPLKDSHLFKIVESVISFYFKKFYNSIILNKWESFSGMVDHVTCPPWGPYNFSKTTHILRKKKIPKKRVSLDAQSAYNEVNVY